MTVLKNGHVLKRKGEKKALQKILKTFIVQSLIDSVLLVLSFSLSLFLFPLSSKPFKLLQNPFINMHKVVCPRFYSRTTLIKFEAELFFFFFGERSFNQTKISPVVPCSNKKNRFG